MYIAAIACNLGPKSLDKFPHNGCTIILLDCILAIIALAGMGWQEANCDLKNMLPIQDNIQISIAFQHNKKILFRYHPIDSFRFYGYYCFEF